jgi:hypothetical protein
MRQSLIITRREDMIEDIKGEDYIVLFDEDSITVYFKGKLTLYGPTEYAPIADLLNRVAQTYPATITLNLKKLESLNSSGINMLSKFVLSLRKKKEIQLIIIGSDDMPWQGRSLRNLERLLPGIKIENK